MSGRRSDERARNQVHQKMDDYLAYYKETARKIGGEQIQFIFCIFLVAKLTRSRSESMNGFKKVKENMDKSCLQKLVFIELFSWEMNEILTSSKEPKGGKALFLQAAERNAAYVARFKLGYFMYIGPD